MRKITLEGNMIYKEKSNGDLCSLTKAQGFPSRGRRCLSSFLKLVVSPILKSAQTLKDFFQKKLNMGKDNSCNFFLCQRFYTASFFVFYAILFNANSSYAESAKIDLEIISQIESSNRNHVIGDNGRSFGRFQISKTMLADFNARNKTNITPLQLLNEEKAAHVVIWIFEVRLKELLKDNSPSVLELLIAYNCGASCKNPENPITKSYIKKYKKLGGRI